MATGRDFGSNGAPKAGVMVVDEARARSLADALGTAEFTVAAVDTKPYRSSPRAPFMTSTLQQEGGRKLRLSASQVMRVAQGLYERGFITYMRTDNVVLSAEALGAVRAEVQRAYGQDFLSPSPRQFSTKIKNAQEAHEAIRPTTPLRSPDAVAGELNGQELLLYRMIWQRTLASQMADAAGTTVSVQLAANAAVEGRGTACRFAASGTTITFPGYRQVYVESSDDAADPAEREALLPPLTVGQVVPADTLTPNGHTTSSPARYTEASLVKRLEELGIGRPSTWASIIQTVQDRGYVWKKGQALVPTWTAFAVVGLMEKHFDGLVDYEFTARVEEDLDSIARQERQKQDWLQHFYFGDDGLGNEGASGEGTEHLPGLKRLVEENLDHIDAAEINTFPLGNDPDGNLIVVKPGKFGPYVKRGDDTASVPEDMAPDELTVDVALSLLAQPKSDEPIGELDGYPVFAKNGRYGPYVQWGAPDNLPPGLEKPKMSSLFKTMVFEKITMDDAEMLLSLPRTLGVDPADDQPIVAANGRYGPYVQKGKDYRSIANEDQLLTISLGDALKIFSEPKVFRRGGANMAAKGPLREFGTDPVSERAVVAKDGKFGVYVTDGETNASLSKGDRLEAMLPERAYELLAIRREAIIAKGGPAARKATATTRKAAAKRAPAKKSAAKKAPAKKTAAKRSAPRKRPAD